MINYYQAVPRTDQTKTIAVYVYDGTNAQESIDFINKFRANSNRMTEPIYRPKDIPNLDYGELFKWWESTGEMVEDKRWHGSEPHYVNTHNENNCPIWRKDEEFCIVIPSTDEECRAAHLCQQVFMKKGDALYFANGYVDHCPHFTSIEDLLDDLDLVLIKK